MTGVPAPYEVHVPECYAVYTAAQKVAVDTLVARIEHRLRRQRPRRYLASVTVYRVAMKENGWKAFGGFTTFTQDSPLNRTER